MARGTPLTFDQYGRIGISGTDAFVVLNDNVWKNLLEAGADPIPLNAVKTDSDGTLYYASLASWGRLEKTPSGCYRATPLLQEAPPSWVLSTHFDRVLLTSDSVYIAGFNGMIRWDRASRKTTFFEVPNLSSIYVYEGNVFISTHSHERLRLDLQTNTLERDTNDASETFAVRHFVDTGPHTALIATMGRHLLRLAGDTVEPVTGRLGGELPGPVLAMQRLPEGEIAVSVAAMGVFLVDSSGRVKTEIAGPNDPQITNLACMEPGVLWGATEHGVVKIFYRSRFDTFGQADGIPVVWPQIVSWDGGVIVASGGRFYESVPESGTGERPFRPLQDEPKVGGWGIATSGDTLFLGNNLGVFARTPGKPFECVLAGLDAFRLAASEDGTCFVIGEREIAALRKTNGEWREAAPRIKGGGNPYNVHSVDRAVWIELGVNRVARLTMKSGAIQLQTFEDFGWDPGWIHVSSVGHRVILAGAKNHRAYYNEDLEQFTSAAELDRVLSASPVPVRRLLRDSRGVYWGSYDSGVLTLTPRGADLQVDQRGLAGISEVVPRLQVLEAGTDVWVCGRHSLARVSIDAPASDVSMAPAPTLVSARDDRTNLDLLNANSAIEWRRLPYRNNSLTLAFFRGTYVGYRSHGYRHRLNDGGWVTEKNSSRVSLYDLREGDYRLAVQAVDDAGPFGATSTFEFAVLPPWYRTWFAFAAYGSLGVILLFAASRLSARRTRARNRELQRLVSERTRQLERTIVQLGEEARERATLEERNRLANEIHDSLEQGFTGLAMQLEATSRLPLVGPEVSAGIQTAIEMISFCRKEVRNAVRNLHSAILDNRGLDNALGQLIKQLGLPDGAASLEIIGAPRPLSSSVEHHLIRIAQEAIANVVKHARAQTVAVTLNYTDDAVSLTVADDGVGLATARPSGSASGHFGVPSIRERVKKMGGLLEIVSSPGKGTRLKVQIPTRTPVLQSN